MMASHSSAAVADSLFNNDSQRPPVPGCGGILRNSLPSSTTKSSLVPNLAVAHLFHPVASAPPLTVASLTLLKPLPEPDGCTSKISPCDEDSAKPGLLSKMVHLVSLLNDRHGVTHFRQFLTKKHASGILEFWLACVGFRKVDPARRSSFALVIYKTFVVSAASRVRLSGSTRRSIKERLKCGDVNHAMFDSAVSEVESLLLRDYYPQFLESDDYAEYLQTRSANQSPSSDGSSGNSSNCTSHTIDGASRQLRNEETQSCSLDSFPACAVLKEPKTHSIISASNQCTGDCMAQTGERNSLYCDVIPTTTTPAVAALASSISDDTLSFTDASLSLDDGHDNRYTQKPATHRSRCSHAKAHRANCSARTKCGGSGSILAQKDPEGFASLLTAKLNRLTMTTMKHEDHLDRDSGLESFQDAVSGSVHVSLSSSSKMAAISSVLLAEAASEEENAESILERHVSLVFSGADTEETAPPFDSALTHHHNILRAGAGGHHSTHDHLSSRHVKSSSVTQSYSAAEGNWSLSENNPLCVSFRTSVSFGDGDLASQSKLLSELSPRPSHERTSSAHVHSTAAVGVLKHSQHQQRHLVSCQHTNAEMKVRKWINEQMAEPLTASHVTTRCSSGRRVVQPSQPIIQDPSMPLLSPPDPTVQLEEARRRLQTLTTTSTTATTTTAKPRSLSRGISRPLSHNRQTSLPANHQVVVVIYFMCDEPVPYCCRIHTTTGAGVTLRQFKDVIVRRGSFRYYFKRACNEFNTDVVYEEVTEDDAELPLIDGKICAKVVKMLS